jgi:outer membrane protein assembly factor BamE
MNKLIKRLTLVALLPLLTACANFGAMDFPGVYKISIPQGNIITQDMVDQLRPGMTKRQVVFVMGTPLVRDPFHQDRWDYVYNFQPGGGIRGQEKVTVFFVDDALVSFTGDFSPTPEPGAVTDTTDEAATDTDATDS